jgi:hypothetical protein
MFHATFLICFINLIVALMTVNVADVTSNMQAAWLVEISQLMIELELYWPRPYTYDQPEMNINNESNSLYGSIMALDAFKRYSVGIHSHHASKNHELNRINVILYTSPREVVAKSTWWKDYPKVDGKIQDVMVGSSMFDMDVDSDLAEIKEETSGESETGNNTPGYETPKQESFKIVTQDMSDVGITIDPFADVDPPLEPKAKDPIMRSSSNLSWNKLQQHPSFNGGLAKRRLTINPIQRRNSAIVNQLQVNSPKPLLGKPFFADRLAGSIGNAPRLSGANPKDSMHSIHDSIGNTSIHQSSQAAAQPTQAAESPTMEHIHQLEKAIKYEFKKNREVFSKVEQVLQQQKVESQVKTEFANYSELLQMMKSLQDQVDQLQKRPVTWMDRIFGASPRTPMSRRSYSMPFPRHNVKQTYPDDANV